MKKASILLCLIWIYGKGISQTWQQLFDGKTLNSWAVVDKPANVKIADSSIVLHMTPYTSRHAFVRTNEKYKDFIFEVEYRRDLALDGGVLFRSINAPDTAFSALFGYMVKIDPQPNRKWTGGVFIDFGNGYQWLKTLEGDENARKAEKKGGEWNTLRIEAQGQNLRVWLNGVPTANLIDDKYTEGGYIAFKIHFLQKDIEKANLEMAFRQPKIITKNLSKYAQNMPLPVTDTRGVWKIQYFR
jgi:hypothetical protein